MPIKHAYQVTGVDDATKQVSKDRWNAEHSIDTFVELPETTDPTAPAVGLRWYAKRIGGRVMTKQIGPSGVDTPLQPFLGMNHARILSVGTGTTAALIVSPIATAFTAAATTFTQPTPATGTRKAKMRLSSLATSAVAGQIAYIKGNTLECARETGFFLVIRATLDTLAVGNLGFFGLWSSVTALTATTNPVTAVTARVGLAFQVNTGNWQLVVADGAAVTALDLGANFPINTTDILEIVLFSAPGGADIKYRITNMTTGSEVSNTLAATLPGATTYMTFHETMSNNATAGIVKFSHKALYLETDD